MKSVSEMLARYIGIQRVLCCPITKNELRLVDMANLRLRLSAAESNRLPDDAIGAFICEVSCRAYIVTSHIANFLIDESLLVTDQSGIAFEATPTLLPDDEVRRSVKQWYDDFGWRKSESGQYKDSLLFSQDYPIGHGLYEMMSHVSLLDRLAGGDFVLDAASGAIPHPEYLAFSWFYKSRVCVDMSIVALEEARAKLGSNDFCCLADICALPFRDNTFDGAISAYTIQHIPESKQGLAVSELFRVIRPNAHLCILTGMDGSASRRVIVKMLKLVRRGIDLFGLTNARANSVSKDNGHPTSPPQPLYCRNQRWSWWKNLASGMSTSHSIETLRFLDKSEFEFIFGNSNRAAKLLRMAECILPRVSACFSLFCLIDIQKRSSIKGTHD